MSEQTSNKELFAIWKERAEKALTKRFKPDSLTWRQDSGTMIVDLQWKEAGVRGGLIYEANCQVQYFIAYQQTSYGFNSFLSFLGKQRHESCRRGSYEEMKSIKKVYREKLAMLIFLEHDE